MNELSLHAEMDRLTAYAQAYPMGLCADCPRPATIECPDQYGRCELHAVAYAHKLVADSPQRFVNRLSPHGKKMRAKRRKARKLNRGR